ncbi:scytonemin biosynthesis PEP-CTERM protein ScyF [Nostoc sphaeroides]|jgi:DNA-binding beta-propeller fold protein YncE|uniref:PEP-CTERM sorting domain-containing protein n=1 Tax=Nostoc sphaeroides CCNUC1 TaxID=2653204 RepID=A0A5P8VYE1_9NOSO|nr:scytonemin biosynthesis PEP-CTERM protein ScyF [Nostoc sphaeroides]MCC5629313.1 scytonemin biosynthesis PEP-CTERM protein ScyF [Nostoc sphaeroides CHAB 2801]QFS44839.1 PEP-CTERM sorting domain-containing protein [Nostoc sphaeroides CCNUC1]
MGLVKNFSIGILGTGFMVLATVAQAKAVTLTFDRSIGEPGFGPGQLFVPQGIAVDSQGNTLIANGRGINPADGTPNYNLGNKIEIFNPSGQYIGAIGSGGTGPGQFDEPTTVDFNPVTGDLYSGDVYNNRINQFDSQGNFIRSFANGEFTPLVEDRLFFGPSGLTFDKDGNVYVGDFNGERILKYTSDGQQLGVIGGTRGSAPGEFQGVAGVRISPVSGNIFVADQYNNRVQVLDPTGSPLLAFGSAGSEPGQLLQPIGIEVDDQENVYVADSINSRVQVFDKNGNFLTSFGEPALDASGNPVPPPAFTGPPFGNPLDLTPGRFNWTGGTTLKDDKLYVGDFFQGRVQVLNVEGRKQVPEPSSALSLALLGLGAATITLRKRGQQKPVFSLEKTLQKQS